mmetsp:Transcript_22525/g.69797  ORF Transcript_22525/g.69797 Transcript_22525/m.69797 type:complete len:133 (+) Transcript_22525:46-444(+)
MARFAAVLLAALFAGASAFTAPRGARKAAQVEMSLGKTLRPAAAPAIVAAGLQFGAAPSFAETEVRQGLYKEYTVETGAQKFDDATSKYKTKKETAGGKNRYIVVLGTLLVGSFIIPMAQFWWYIKDDEPLE